MKKSKTNIGSKNIMNYIAWIIFEFDKGFEEVELSAIGSNINKQERLIQLFKFISEHPIKEGPRKNEKYHNMTSIIRTLVRKEKK